MACLVTVVVLFLRSCGGRRYDRRPHYCFQSSNICPCSADPFFSHPIGPLQFLLPCSPPVTVQIYLSRSSKRAGSTDTPKPYTVAISGRPAHPTPSDSKAAPLSERGGAKTSVRKPPMLTLPLKKSASQSSYSPLDMPSYRSPIKSPSQYFQICY